MFIVSGVALRDAGKSPSWWAEAGVIIPMVSFYGWKTYRKLTSPGPVDSEVDVRYVVIAVGVTVGGVLACVGDHHISLLGRLAGLVVAVAGAVVLLAEVRDVKHRR